MHIGKITIGTIDDWTPAPGVVTSWHPTSAAMAKARQAPVSTVPVSYMQGQHIRGVYEQAAKGLDYSRQIIATCEVPGICDIDAMNHALNSYLRRHDTYRSWFSYDGSGDIVRHTITDPADIEFEPVVHGEITTEDARKHIVDIPSPLEWGCFSFGIVQSEDHFDFYASIDHVHGDAALIGITMLEAHGMYTSLTTTGQPMPLPEAGHFDDFCVQERERTAALTVDSPEVRAWIEFAENNNNSMPEFPLPLGDPSVPTIADMVGEMLLDAEQTARFDAACVAAGVRFVGGLYACTAMVEHELTGAATYYGLTPRDTRRTSDNFMTQGWFTGLVPLTVPIAATTFAEAAWSAQTSFDRGLELARVPYYRVLELAPWLDNPRPNFPVSNFLHGGAAPLNAVLAAAEMGYSNNIGIYSDGRFSYQLTVYVFRYDAGTAMAVMFPDNEVAQKSVTRYIATMKSVIEQVAETGDWGRFG
ncbi:condensation domain-containing protein [Mycolicibacterium neoaurum]|uniref:Condensation domain-containing protein n=1 Tax=Mycolicibacterium neoaurum TaxID=1795 RepID=A0AAV2WE91_MYCNE|nr:condensation domain-containing protein [Mycolicibacterium neoaurum]TLH60771.1 acyltransferase [Mycolicibacterium neoaurum]CDQ42454.1 condensation domain-containing protein [Mycolicibacterium neoaurum]